MQHQARALQAGLSKRAAISPRLANQGKSRNRQRTAAVKEREARPENVPGAFYVDHTCIDCDCCRWMEPHVFGRVNQQSAVVQQPKTEDVRFRAAQALMACPTHSIHLTEKQSGELKAAANSFPFQIPNTENLYHCGYHAEHSFGAASYFLTRPGGNILIDSPRFDATLLKNIKALGGAKYMFLSHKDDVADHDQWAEALGLQRILHSAEVTSRQGTDKCEIILEGKGPWRLPGGAKDVEIIFTPGHTKGHISMLYQNETNPSENACFTGDHLAFAPDNRLTIFRRYNQHSIDIQFENVEMLTQHSFTHLLPGHGRPGTFKDHADRIQQIKETTLRG